MAFGSVTLIPGVSTELTPTLNKAGVSSANMIRYKEGLIEKIGGWSRFYPSPLTGIARDLHAWEDLNANTRLSVATTDSLNVITNGVNNQITPQTTTTNSAPDYSTTMNDTVVSIVDPNISNPTINNAVFFNTPVAVGGLVLSGIYPINTILGADSYTIIADTPAATSVSNGGAVPTFDTTSGSATVTVTFANHGYVAGDTVIFLVSTTVGGVTIYGPYIVQTVPTADSYTINTTSQATSTTSGDMNGGDVQLVYYIGVGPSATTAGYGVGTYGSGGYGTGVAPPSGTGTPITAVDWTQDNWGEILLACPKNGPIYYWSPISGFQTANIIVQGPVSNGGIFVAMPQQILVAWGSSIHGFADPLEVRWSDSEDLFNWTASSTSFAGSFHIPTGSLIVGGIQAPQQALIFTDIDVYSMRYINLPLVFGFTKLMTGCGLIGSHALCILGTTVYWMSQKQFFMLPAGGSPRPLPCKVWDVIFQNLNTANSYKIRMGGNAQFNEIWIHYPSNASVNGENDSYVKYNVVEGEWDYGQLPTGRTAWIDQSVLGAPIATDPTGLVFQHEQGYNGDGAALNPYFQTGYWVIGEGEEYFSVDQFLPDIRRGLYGATQTASVVFTFFTTDWPSGDVITFGPYTTSSTTKNIALRLRGRQMAMRMESLDLNSFWRIGKSTYRYAPDGRR